MSKGRQKRKTAAEKARLKRLREAAKRRAKGQSFQRSYYDLLPRAPASETTSES